MDEVTMPGSATWRAVERQRLLRFAAGARLATGGFGWLDDDGAPVSSRDLELWLNARMTYVFALAQLTGDSPAEGLAEHGVQALRTLFHDDSNGGWHDEVSTSGEPIDQAKRCYSHSFVILAGAAATAADIPGGTELLTEALDIHETHFWDESAGACVEERSRSWKLVSDYRGANSNMHTVEAYLAAADVTGDDVWRMRAVSICDLIINRVARHNHWRIPEHFDADWFPRLDYNLEKRDDPFRPYGATPGHAFEWARLLLQLDASLGWRESWMVDAAKSLFGQAVTDTVGDGPGIPYTTDWNGHPVVAERFHWVMAEAILAADSLNRLSGDEAYASLCQRWWSEVAEHFCDGGSWRHELSAAMEPSARTWAGRPDAFHIFNALTLPDLPLSPAAAISLRG